MTTTSPVLNMVFVQYVIHKALMKLTCDGDIHRPEPPMTKIMKTENKSFFRETSKVVLNHF